MGTSQKLRYVKINPLTLFTASDCPSAAAHEMYLRSQTCQLHSESSPKPACSRRPFPAPPPRIFSPRAAGCRRGNQTSKQTILAAPVSVLVSSANETSHEGVPHTVFTIDPHSSSPSNLACYKTRKGQDISRAGGTGTGRVGLARDKMWISGPDP